MMLDRICSRRRFLADAGGAIGAAWLLPSRLMGAEVAETTVPAGAQIAFGVCGSVGNAPRYREAGLAYIEAGVTGLLIPDQDEIQFTKNLTQIQAAILPVKACNNFIPGKLKAVGGEAKHAQILGYAEIAFRRAKQAGIEVITFGSGASRQVPAGWSTLEARTQFSDLLARMGPLAAAQGVRVAVEPLNEGECNFLNNIREVGAVVRAAQHPNIGITADLYHMVLGGDTASDLDDHIGLLHHFHIAEKAKRAMPGVAGDDFRPWFRVLAKHGWRGRMSLEANGGNEANAYATAVQTLQNQATQAGI